MVSIVNEATSSEVATTIPQYSDIVGVVQDHGWIKSHLALFCYASGWSISATVINSKSRGENQGREVSAGYLYTDT
jgi:hypothetical protein